MKPFLLKKSALYLALTILITATAPPSLAGSSPGKVDYSSNDILYYDENAADVSCSVDIVSVGSLPSGTTSQLDSAGIKSKAQSNMERYKYAEDHTGVPWQITAAIHYREGSMKPDVSIADGSPLSSGVSVDGLPISKDPNIDTKNQVNHFINMAKSVYGLNAAELSSWNIDDWGNAFLAYNRGYMYKSAGEPYSKSPYVMNGYSEDYTNMPWIRADSYHKGRRLNGLYDSGKSESRPGALSVVAYLGYDFTSGESSSGDCSGGGGSRGDIAEKAIELSWPDRSKSKYEPKKSYVDAMSEVGMSNSGCPPNGADCGVFVATVMRASGADPDFPMGTEIIKNYLHSNPDKYEKQNVSDTGGLQPGDIFIISGHTMIYVGDAADDGGKSNASASCSDQTANRGVNIYFSDYRGSYEIFRKK